MNLRALIAALALALPVAVSAEDGVAISTGTTVLDGGQLRAPVLLDARAGTWEANAGIVDAEYEFVGASRVLNLGDVDFTVGGILVTETTSRISSGANFYFGAHYDWGRVRFSARHISNGAQTFGHDREPNSGENLITVGYRF